MSEEIDDVVDNLKQGSTWLRILFMLGFCVVLYIVAVVVLILTLAQALFSVFSGSDNRNLRALGSSLSEYVSQILNFMTYNSEERPFPFAPFPDAKGSATAMETSEQKEQKPAVKKKPAAKKKPETKKKSAGANSAKTKNDKAD